MYKPQLVVMLTHNDKTVSNAADIFEQSKDSKAQIWGFKEEGIPVDEMKALYSEIKKAGKTTVLEVVAYTEDKCIEGAKVAVECGCDVLMGTIYNDTVNAICKENNIKYMPFVGDVYERPSILGGSIDGMINEANELLKKGVYGFDLLAYRYTGDASELIKRFVAEVDAPVCLAGSVDSNERLREVFNSNTYSFTIGSAFFENQFGSDFKDQIDYVCDYIDSLAQEQANA